ncbi:porin [Oceanospirillaceae bacterium]|nr:porin [Oceanospirillaceae bacterium]
MNKTLIALAIAAALPVAAQADMTLSGSVTTEYTNTGVIDTDAALSLSASEVLANGMTATASLDVLAGENQGSATLTGDFGSLTVGEIDSDGAFQAADVGGVVANTEDADEGGTTVSGIHFTTTQAGLSLSAQLNATSGADAAVGETRSTQLGMTYDLNGLTVGYAYASADADSTDGPTGVTAAMNAFGVSYAFGDLVVTAGKQNLSASGAVSPDAIVSATYTMTVDALTVTAQTDTNPSGDYQIDLSYAMSDALTLSSEIDKGNTTTLVASYTSGDMTASVSKTDDGTTDASVALDFGNADLTLARNGGDADTSVTYSVAF